MGGVIRLRERDKILAKTLKVGGWYSQLEQVHAAFGLLATQVETFTGVPLCVPNCGLCCKDASVMAIGVEAEYARSLLLGNAGKMANVLDACREWLTKPGKYTYGTKLTPELFTDKREEWARILQERCALLGPNDRCIFHEGRPVVCRAYGVTHVPNPYCRRPIGLNESADAKAHWDVNDPSVPIKKWWLDLKASMDDPRFTRQGFFATMIMEALATRELAGLAYDGKIPLFKMAVGWGGDLTMLWQEDVDREWSSYAADVSIADQPALEDRNGVPTPVYKIVRY